MAKTTDKLIDRADDMRPYVDRALHDEDLRENLKEAFAAARDVYSELLGNRGAVGVAQRVATDKDIQDNLKRAVDELRTAATACRARTTTPRATDVAAGRASPPGSSSTR